MTVSEKLQVLKETYPDGKEFVLVVDKLLDSALSEHHLRLARYNRELQEFEQRFGVDSATLYRYFNHYSTALGVTHLPRPLGFRKP